MQTRPRVACNKRAFQSANIAAKLSADFQNACNNDIKRAKEMGITDLDKKYQLNEIISGDSIFCATGITSGDLVSGIQKIVKTTNKI